MRPPQRNFSYPGMFRWLWEVTGNGRFFSNDEHLDNENPPDLKELTGSGLKTSDQVEGPRFIERGEGVLKPPLHEIYPHGIFRSHPPQKKAIDSPHRRAAAQKPDQPL